MDKLTRTEKFEVAIAIMLIAIVFYRIIVGTI